MTTAIPAHPSTTPKWARYRRHLIATTIPGPCPRCGMQMRIGDELDMGHAIEFSRTGITNWALLRIEHAKCNRAAGAIYGNKRRNRLAGHSYSTREW